MFQYKRKFNPVRAAGASLFPRKEANLPETTLIEIPIDLDSRPRILDVFGIHDRNLRLLESSLGLKCVLSGETLKLEGSAEAINVASKVIRYLIRLHDDPDHAASLITDEHLKYYIRQLKANPDLDMDAVAGQSLKVSRRGKIVRSLGAAQTAYLQAIANERIVFGIGPAGTGKTYLAMAYAINQLIQDAVRKIILVRPVVEAGESLGFLPGDLAQKINPYLRPLYDAVFDMIGFEAYQQYEENGRIEVAPLAYMRGRTLNNSVIILDEAQNTTFAQMKMFLTRLGTNSRMIITGDVTQIDLPDSRKSGLVSAARILRKVEGISFVNFSGIDVVRHRLVQEVIAAYEQYEEKRRQEHG